MDNLIFSLNATIPVFLLMALGYIFRRAGLISDALASGMNTFVFKVSLPVLVFSDLATVDFSRAWDTKFVLFCFFVTLFSIAFAAGISFLWRDKSLQGEFIQAAYRSSAALLGFRDEKLVAILVMLGSATTVSSYVMARSMGHEGTLSSSVVMLTTLFSAFTLTFWLWLLRSQGLI